MKFNAYIVELKNKENAFTGSLTTPQDTVSATFKKIGKDIFIANFKTQMEFKFLEKVPFDKREKDVLVLLPVLSKYNKRKLTKISKFLSPDTPETRETYPLLLNLLSVEKFLKARELIPFFALKMEELLDFLIQKEIKQEIKIIDLSQLAITTYENVRNYLDELRSILTDYYTRRINTIKFSEFETQLKLTQFSFLFKYLLHCCREEFQFNIQKDKIVFQKFGLSEDEMGSMDAIKNVLKKGKLTIFTIENIITNSNLLAREVNDTMWSLIEREQLVQLSEKFYIFNDDLNKIINKLKKYKRNEGETIDIQSFRELTLLSRKYIIILFEYFDTQGVTQREENHRKIMIPA